MRVLGPQVPGPTVTPSLAVARKCNARIVTLKTGVVVRAGGPLERIRRRAIEQAAREQGWIDIDDLIGLIHHAIYTESTAGDYLATPGRAEGLGADFEFTTLERSLEHQAGREDPGAVERALARWPREPTQSRGAA